jgi:CRP-like cAMP-binding protein
VQSIDQSKVKNRLLKAMAPETFASFQPFLEQVDLPLRHVLAEANRPPTHVYFIESGLASLVATSTDNESIEIGHIGREGMSGTHLLLKTDISPTRTFLQVAGTGIRLPVSAFLELLDKSPSTRDLFLLYTHCSEIQLAHSALANARYSVNERLARWLLMCHDRLDGDDLALTHEFLALMLGVRRSGVTNEIHMLEGLGAIRATRGNVRILDRSKLEDIASGSYGIPEREYDRLIGPATPR